METPADRRPSAPRGLTVTIVVALAVVAAAVVSMALRGRPFEVLYARWLLHSVPAAMVLLSTGYLVLRRRPGHGAGRSLVAVGLLTSAHAASGAIVDARLAAAGITDAHASFVPADLPLDAAIPVWIMSWLWVVGVVVAVTLLPLVFPDGRLPGRQAWWAIAAAAVGAGLLMTAHGIVTWPSSEVEMTILEMPLDTSGTVTALVASGGLLVLAGALAAVALLLRRARHADAGTRGAFRAVGIAAGLLAVVGVATWPWPTVWRPSILVAVTTLLVTYGLAVARYRRADLEPVIGRAAVGAILAVLVTGVYLATVVGVGSLIGRRGEGTLLPLLAVGVIAILIEPARRRARTLVDRVLYGRDTSRAELLGRLAQRAGDATSLDDVLDDLVHLLLRSTGAERAEVQLEQDGRSRAISAGAPSRGQPAVRAPVVHAGHRLGEVRLYARHPSDLVQDAEQLMADVTHSLAVLIRNDHLTEELRRKLHELRRSEQRLVEAHDRARETLERDIHDGAQSRLIGLRLRVGAARALAESSQDHGLIEQLDAIGVELEAAVRELRELARGLLPPVLEQSGLAAALRAHARALPLPVAVRAEGVGRYPRSVEAAVYLSCLESLQNAARHARSTSISIAVEADEAWLRFTITDDGVGFEPRRVPSWSGLRNIDDRITALGGRIAIDSSPGAGTRITGEIPVQPSISAR